MDDKKIVEVFASNIHNLRKSKNMTQSDFADLLGVSPSTISDWEKAKKYPRAGTIEKIASTFGIYKSKLFEEQISVTDLYDGDDEVVPVPIIGRVSCGNGVLNIDEIEGMEDTPKSWVRGGDFFYVRAEGDSMINARIFPGDLLLIRKQNDVEEGEIAAVLIGEKVYLKRVFKNDGIMVLQSENPEKYGPIFRTADNYENIQIIGKLKKIVIDM
ncbi:LexA family protein [Paenibacillus pabuli]|uniref:LexA family protein n=1 Tax=Paenibacillus pabuli TaxID=1472 RepID=UPI001FFFE2F0|nr:XRE family transcriptional regulator [Paenibacillus pabuli]UPK45737.1 helix-turn-helix domain-containing protein [Paenibacillus pabuli]